MAFDWTALATLLSNMASSRAQGQVQQSQLDAQNNAGATSRYQAMVNANRLQNIEQPMANANQARLGNLLSSFQPVSVSHPRANIPTVSGGPQMTPELRQMGTALANSALQRQMSGNPIDTSTFPSDEELGLTNNTKGGGFLDTLLGVGSTAAGIGSLIAPLLKTGTTTAGVLPSTGISAPGYSTLPGGAAGKGGSGVGVGGGGVSTGQQSGPQGLQNMATLYQLGNFGLAPSQYNDQTVEDSDRWMARLNARKQRRG